VFIYLFVYARIISSYRTLRGFAIKFYSDDGIWDLLGLNIPILVNRDPMLFPVAVHALKRNPVTNIMVRIVFEYQLQNIHCVT
jgi:catalase